MSAYSNNSNNIDENLYSRQLYALGHNALEVMKKMSQTSVLICGMCGLGNEIAKNAILSGFKEVTIHDTELVSISDLSSHYYVTENDIGLNRASVCYPKLKKLNPYVTLNYYTEPLTDEYMKQFSVIVLTNSLLDEQIRINELCRTNNIKFIGCNVFGLAGYIFCDFGENFLIVDTDGEQPLTSLVENITNDGIVTCIDTKPHGLSTGDYVRFSNVKGMTQLNTIDQIEIQYINATSFRLKYDISSFTPYSGDGEITQVKQSKTLNFLSLKESLNNPEFVITNFADFDRPSVLHAANIAYNEYIMQYNEMPTLNVDKFEKYMELVKKHKPEANKNVIEKFVHCLNGNLCPMTGILGGTVAQEIIKASSGKFHPINQWLYFDAFECLPDNYKEFNTTPINCRYDGQIAVFGQDFQKKLENLKYFIVGSGAIGCELLKNFAMIGVGCGENGKVVITDMDTIEKSNLNRQFLFRNNDIGQLKSTTAAKAIKNMNPNVNIEAHANCVGVNTENIYNREFMEGLDGVANALDNVQARKYMDSRCVLFCKSLLESGTLGTKGNVQVVVPYLTESYGSSEDPPEKSIPVCTIKNFPNQIEHTIQHARDLFHGRFYDGPSNLIKYIENPDMSNMAHTDAIVFALSIKSVLEGLPKSFEDCIKYAYKLWHEDYYISIKQLLNQFPPDHLTSSGAPFWSAGKKCPHVSEFDPCNPLHYEYIIYTSKIWANIFGININSSDEYIMSVLYKQTPPVFESNNKVKFSVTEEEEKQKQKELVSQDYKEVIATFPSDIDFNSLTKLTIVPQVFEKDDDSNHHIDFITAASNMRATLYQIPTANKHSTKGIAGKIIPALATTTSVIAGLVSLELYKLTFGNNNYYNNNLTDLERYHNAYINLALPFFAFTDPKKAPGVTYKDKRYTLWDNFTIKGDITLEEFLNYFEDKDITIDFLSYGSFTIYSDILPMRKIIDRKGKTIKTIIESESGITLNTDMIVLTIGVEPLVDKNGNDVEVDLPNVKYYF